MVRFSVSSHGDFGSLMEEEEGYSFKRKREQVSKRQKLLPYEGCSLSYTKTSWALGG